MKNTDWIYGVAIYTGHQTKIMMNSCRSKSKRSRLEKAVNYYLIMNMAIQAVVCLASASWGQIWIVWESDYVFYLDIDKGKKDGVSETVTI